MLILFSARAGWLVCRDQTCRGTRPRKAATREGCVVPGHWDTAGDDQGSWNRRQPAFRILMEPECDRLQNSRSSLGPRPALPCSVRCSESTLRPLPCVSRKTDSDQTIRGVFLGLLLVFGLGLESIVRVCTCADLHGHAPAHFQNETIAVLRPHCRSVGTSSISLALRTRNTVQKSTALSITSSSISDRSIFPSLFSTCTSLSPLSQTSLTHCTVRLLR